MTLNSTVVCPNCKQPVATSQTLSERTVVCLNKACSAFNQPIEVPNLTIILGVEEEIVDVDLIREQFMNAPREINFAF